MVSDETKITSLGALGTNLRLNIGGTKKIVLSKAFIELYEEITDSNTKNTFTTTYNTCLDYVAKRTEKSALVKVKDIEFALTQFPKNPVNFTDKEREVYDRLNNSITE